MEKKRWIKSIIILIIILFMSELVMLFSGKVGVLNTMRRVTSGAPHVVLKGQTLSYQGKVNFDDIQSVEGYSTSDEGAVLYKAKGTPISPPWIYVRKENTTFFRYKLPKLPWKL
ncbi:hypothetical protein [Paenibacillus sp. FSL K6-0108]|uniref:hypothetical protein n=1 Tax=Paenibacillus sp. FSL K6-0108 TaxID=2921417 RepID=UPI003250B2F4